MSEAFLKLFMGGDYADFPVIKIRIKTGHFFIKLHRLIFIPKSFTVRRIAEQQPFGIRSCKFGKIGLNKIRSLYFCIDSNRLQCASCRYTSVFGIALTAFNCGLVNVRTCYADFNIGADFFRFQFSDFRRTFWRIYCKIFKRKTSSESRSRIVCV